MSPEPGRAALEWRGWAKAREGGSKAEEAGRRRCGNAGFVFPPSSLAMELLLQHTRTHTNSLCYHVLSQDCSREDVR